MSAKQVVSSAPLQGSQSHQRGTSLGTSCQNWALPGFGKVAKACLHGGIHFLPGTDDVCSHHLKKTEQPHKDAASKLTSCDSIPRRFRHQRSATREGRTFQPPGFSDIAYDYHGDHAHGSKIPSVRRHLKPVLSSTTSESLTSQVQLTLQVKVSGQRDGLGISIAGGKGSLPYKDQDEGIFISRVTKGGPSEKAGVHVGDRLLEVNSLSMQGATHLEAVRALRNAGSRIRMRVLREGLQVSRSDEGRDTENPATRRPFGNDDARGQRCTTSRKPEDRENCLSKKKDVVVCNGNGITDLKTSQLEAEGLAKRNVSVNVDKHTITIPRIVLTHPSTSDEDVELLPQALSNDVDRNVGILDSHVTLECLDSAFYSH
ncbi:uncharacterized protein LOC144084845 [Stigmatopora argus]